MKVCVYLRASTTEQKADRAEESLIKAITDRGHTVEETNVFRENKSGATLERPELRRMLNSLDRGDVIAIESMDRLGRLVEEDRRQLMREIDDRGVSLFVLDLTPSHIALEMDRGQGTTAAILELFNRLLMELHGIMAREDYEKRRSRQKQGIAKAKEQGKYKGRQADPETLENVKKARAMVATGVPVLRACKAYGIGRATYYRLSEQQENEQ